MIQIENNTVVMHTVHTTYAFRVLKTGQLEHLHYGRRIHGTMGDLKVLSEKHIFAPGNSLNYDEEHLKYTLEDMCLEMSSYGKGDIREPFVEVVHADGSTTSDFCFVSMETQKGRTNPQGLPVSYGAQEEVEQLAVHLRDASYELELVLYYVVFEKADVICRRACLYNHSDQPVQLRRLMSLQLDWPTGDYCFHTFTGAWLREMHHTSLPVTAGKYVNESYTGTSSNHANPFVMLTRENTSEDAGDCYGFHLVYSGNHYEAVQVSAHGKLRLVSGINPQSFQWKVAPGECFETPEAAMTFSTEGCNGMSQQMHRFIQKHIVRGKWANRERPVLLNSWEAVYMDISEEKLLKLAGEAAKAGVELFVMDDGWFGTRDDDTQSLGDWQVNPAKLPNGLSHLSGKIHELGMDFGIWVEPEMVNVNSDLYRRHPEWVMQIPGKSHSEGRNQRVLDLGQRQVQDFIIESMTELFESSEISYVKWDMNRHFSDYFSQSLPADRQGEVAHRYVLGLYRCMQELTSRFPDILFEGCASGGNRFDLGMLCYFPQIWASDNTDAICRSEIQTGYSYGYPMSVVSAHVSASPSHQTRRVTPLDTRFHVAAFGVLGYELNLCELGDKEREEIRRQIEWYKRHRKLMQFGTFYRGRISGKHGQTIDATEDVMEWTVVSEDGKEAAGMLLQRLCVPNKQQEIFYPKGLKEDMCYHFQNVSIATEPQEQEDYHAYGDTLQYGGVRLQQGHTWEREDGKLRCFLDFSSRLYLMEWIS